MDIQEKIRTNKWAQLKYHNPKDILIKLRNLEILISQSNLDEKAKSLRKKEFKKYLEWRAAAIFCHGLAESVLKNKIYYTPVESEDFDCITLWQDGDYTVYTPLQIKEVVPNTINPHTNLNDEILKLRKYSDSNDLVVAIHVNRRENMEFSTIHIPKLQIAELWIFGAITENQDKWFLYGNLLANPIFFDFEYPKY